MSETFRWTWPMSTPGSIVIASTYSVEGLVHERIGCRVLLATDVANRPALELAQRPADLRVELAQARILDPVLPLHLLDDQLRVADELDLAGAELARQLD